MDDLTIYDDLFELYQFISDFGEDLRTFEELDEPPDDLKSVYARYRALGGYLRSQAEFDLVRQQAEVLLAIDPFPAAAVRQITNRRLGGPAECKAWLQNVLRLYQQRIDEETQKSP